MKLWRKFILMKRFVALILTLVTVLFTFTSCSTRLKGTYKSNSSTGNILSVTYTFEGKRVSKTTSMLSYTDTAALPQATGKYDIDYKGAKDGYVITFTWDASGAYATKPEAERIETFKFKKTNTYIQIGDSKFVRSE